MLSRCSGDAPCLFSSCRGGRVLANASLPQPACDGGCGRQGFGLTRPPPPEEMCATVSGRAQRLSESRRVVWVAAHLADHPLAAGAVRHKVKGDGDDEFAYVCDACVERALTCRSRAALTRMLAFHIWLLLGRLWDHSKQSPMSLPHPSANCESDGQIL